MTAGLGLVLLLAACGGSSGGSTRSDATVEAAVDDVLANWEHAITAWEYDEDEDFLIIEAGSLLEEVAAERIACR